MDTNKLVDLRFVIGTFFTIVGLLLLIYSFIDGEAVNRWSGIVFILFGGFMIFISLRKDAADEILEEEKD